MAKNFLVPINMNGLEIQNFLAHNLQSAPTGVAGKLYFNTGDNKLYYYNGTEWVALEANPAAITIDSALSSTSTNPVQNKVINTALGNKVDVVSGKGLSTNDYTTTEKNKLSGIAEGAEVNVQANWTESSSSSDAYIKNKPTLGAAAAKGVDASIASGSTSTNLPTSEAVASLVSTAVGAVDAMRFKGTIGTTGDISVLPTTGVKVGDTYMVVTAGTYAGQTCEVGDLIIATATTPTWTVAQTNIDGAITSISGTAPISATGSGSSRTISIAAASGSAAGSMSSSHYTKLEGIASGAEVNQNAFSNVTVGSTTIAADSKTDTLTLAAGSNVTLTPDATNDKVTIAATDTTYSVVAAGASTTSGGLMSQADKTKLDGIASGAEVNRTYTATTGKPTADQTPAFGGTFTISQISQSTTGQITATDRTVTIPSSAATTSADGLMTAAQVTKLNSLERFATVQLNWGSYATKTVNNLNTANLVSYRALDSSNNEVIIDCQIGTSSTTFSVASTNAMPSKLVIKYTGSAMPT